VIVFSDRVEIWNPGRLPAGLSEEDLRHPHGPLPRNPLLAEPLFRAGYAEKAGSGTTDMIDACSDAGVPEPTFKQHGPPFVVTLWRDWLTDDVLAGLGLNERQLKALTAIRRQTRRAEAIRQPFVPQPLKHPLANGTKTLLPNGLGPARHGADAQGTDQIRQPLAEFAQLIHRFP
jgi:predicted HTH transcriptional regulator